MTEHPMPSYSTAQMDNYYAALFAGIIKPTGIMNMLQHLFIAERCSQGVQVLDVCCGRGLQIPLLKHYAPTIGGYMGIDISQQNLDEAQEIILLGDGKPPAFPYTFICGDVCRLSSLLNQTFDVIIYTSALEHLKLGSGIESLEQVSRVMTEKSTLYLSTPRTEGLSLRQLQHPRAHRYEWGRQELSSMLAMFGLTIIACYGLLPPDDVLLEGTIAARFGEDARQWFHAMRVGVPRALLAPILASAFPEVATELLFVCCKGQKTEQSYG